AARRRTLAELGALEGPLFLLAERAPGDAAIDARLTRVARDADMGGDVRATGSDHADQSTAMQSAAAANGATPAHDALLNLIDARLARIADAAREATPKESLSHARS
ncbi:FUSC family protein, partial [Burkholderia sp. Ac-20353]|nr:FUSC family protein [Burkholderia sp. Ac-20353]